MRRDMPFTACRKRRIFDLPPPNVRRDMPFKACRKRRTFDRGIGAGTGDARRADLFLPEARRLFPSPAL